MGMFDELVFDCPRCGRQNYAQFKIREYPSLAQWKIGTPIRLEEVYPEYLRHLMDPESDNCPDCGAVFVFDCSSGQINIELWDGTERLENPTADYFHDLFLALGYIMPERMHVCWLADILGDEGVKWFI